MCVCAQGKLQSFLAVAAQTLESFVTSLDEEVKTQTEDHNSQEHQFVLALAGTVTSESRFLLHHFMIVPFSITSTRVWISFPYIS